LARDLEEILALARQRDAQRQAEIHSAAAGEADGLQLIAGYGPNVTFSASAGNGRDHVTIKDEDGGEKSANFTESETLLTMEQPLVDVFRGSKALRGTVEMELAAVVRNKAESDLILRVHERYYGYLNARSSLALAEAESRALLQQAQNVAARLALGFDTITSHHEAEARHRLALAAEISRRIEYDNTIKSLEELIDEPLGDVNDLAENDQPPTPSGTQDTWLQRARDGNSDLQSRRLQVEAAEYEYRAAQGQFLPTLKFYASYRDRTSSDGLSGYGEDRQELEAGLRLDLQLLAGGQDGAAVLAASSRLKAAQARLAATRRDLDKRVLSLWQTLKHSTDLITANHHAALENEKALAATQAAYDEGAKVLLDLLNAQQSHYRALGAYRTSRYDHMLLMERLRHAAGENSI
jgi:outer membrane protein